MTAEEIKRQYSMREILARYGLPYKGNKKNISCPFHGKDKNPSMQIFKDGFNCHTCGSHGDIFVFVQLMEKCSFKEAFLSLGGTYENAKEDFSAKIRLEAAKREQHRRVKAEIRQKKIMLDTSSIITFYRSVLAKSEPLSDAWCLAYNNLFYLLYLWEEKYRNGNEVDVNGIIGRYSRTEFVRNIIG